MHKWAVSNSLECYEHMTDALMILRCLCIPERVTFSAYLHGSHGMSSIAWFGTGVLELTRSGINAAWLSLSVVIIYISAAHPTILSENHWP